MASTSCWKCLLRPSVSPTQNAIGNSSMRVPAVAAFSTTAAVNYPPKPAAKVKPGTRAGTKPMKASKTLKIKKNSFVKTGKPPGEGERKAIRKRIVLSNTNALEVRAMRDITPELLLEERQIGRVFGIPGEVVDRLRAVEAFKITQTWGMFRRPGFLVRTESVQVAETMKRAQENGETTAIVVDGERAAGKSLLLLQAMTNAFINDWIVINIPEAQELTTACTDYAQIPSTKPQLYSQNVYTANWLSQIQKSNPILATLRLTQQHSLPIVLQKGDNTTLSELAELGAKDPEVAWPVFNALWAEINVQGRPPVCFTLDGLNHIMQDSAYRSPEYKLIHAHDLAIIRLFTDYLSGAKTFINGGSVFAATSKGNSPSSYAVSHSVVVKNHVQKKWSGPPPELEPYTPLDQRAYESLRHASLLKVNGLSKPEARGLMEYWAASGVMRSRVDDSIVAEKWALSGGGVIGEIERSALWMRFV